ncbi:MAG: PGN_0703 family putative restriction endonuclease [Candidatus Thorarchaeota archaeon]|jgi:hypothetical protein
MTKKSSRQLAQTWPYKRHKKYERELRDAAARWFSKMGFETNERMSYCLRSLENWPQNIICNDVAKYIHNERERNLGSESFPLHKYLHHGLSSQAMVFNLVGPLIVREDFEPLRVVIEQAGIEWPREITTAEFEFDDRTVFNEDSGQPTSIDLVILGRPKGIYIESKFVEKEFGGCSVFSGGDCDGRNPVSYGFDGCYLHHIGRRYWELMEEFSFCDTEFASGHICPFISYYQFFRELLLSLKKEGSFVLLHDERNPTFLKTSKNDDEAGLWPFLLEAVPKEHVDKIGRITVQQLVTTIDKSGRHDDWINDFKSKYGLSSDDD